VDESETGIRANFELWTLNYPGDDGDHMDYEGDQPQLIDLEYLDSIGN
jgi:hypothetical protein